MSFDVIELLNSALVLSVPAIDIIKISYPASLILLLQLSIDKYLHWITVSKRFLNFSEAYFYFLILHPNLLYINYCWFGPIFHIFLCCGTLWISFILSISTSILNALPITKIIQLAVLKPFVLIHWFNFELKVAIFEFCILSSTWVHSTTLWFKLNAGTMLKWFYLVDQPNYSGKKLILVHKWPFLG